MLTGEFGTTNSEERKEWKKNKKIYTGNKLV